MINEGLDIDIDPEHTGDPISEDVYVSHTFSDIEKNRKYTD